jgi:hypothetical protein
MQGEHAVSVPAMRLGAMPVQARRTAQHLADQLARYGTWLPSPGTGEPDGTGRWVSTPLRVVRGQDRNTVNRRNDLAYDGLLITDRD